MVPISATRIGSTVDLTAEFELGLQRLPNNRYQVSIKPERIYEIGVFGSALNTIGAGKIKSMAIARKQIFVFDFNVPEARLAYFSLLDGRLPVTKKIEISDKDRGPEYLLTEFRAQNDLLRPRGISLTYLEKVRIFMHKSHYGMNVPLMAAVFDIVNFADTEKRTTKKRLNLRFEGFDRESMRANAKSVATNGIIAVRKSVFGGRRSQGQGFSGRYNQDLFVTHRRIHSQDESHNGYTGNKWHFDGLVVHYQLEDTKITGDEENVMAATINRLFNTFIGPFEYKNSKAPRIINIEREITVKDLAELNHHDCHARIDVASQASGLPAERIEFLLKEIDHKHQDKQGTIIKHFIESCPGASGFAAIHQLLGARPEELIIRTESGYAQAVLNAKRFIAQFSTSDSESNQQVNLVALDVEKHKKHVTRFYDQARASLRDIDLQLRLLYDDKYLIDEESPLYNIYGKELVQQFIDRGVRQEKVPIKMALVTARKTVLSMLDLASQDFSDEEEFLSITWPVRNIYVLRK